MGFEQTIGLWALAALAPFIIIYLIKPKPIEKVIPSLMFIIKNQSFMQQNSFLKRLLMNLLFLIQLLALAGLAFSIAQPFVTLPYKASAEHTVLVIDASASMQTKYDSGTRFTKAIAEAKTYLSGSMSIVLAENTPVVMMQEGSVSEARDMLNNLKPKATTSNVGDAMLMANDLLNENKGRIVVFSDFLSTEGPDVLVTKRALAAQEQNVIFVDLAKKATNYGIVDATITKTKTKISIKN